MTPARDCEKAPILGPLCLMTGAVAALQLGYSEPGLLYLAPAFLLIAALAFDWYPGERLLVALAQAWHPGSPQERRAPAPLLSPPRSSPRGGVLLAMALAGRGPPA